MRPLGILLMLPGLLAAAGRSREVGGDWPVYGRDGGGTKYSPLSQIDRSNVRHLKVAWTYHTGHMYTPGSSGGGRPSYFESTPLYMDGQLFLTTATGFVIALDPDSGKEVWSYDGKVDQGAGYGDYANRGVATWLDRKSKQRRLFYATIDARLIALDAATGKACTGFGQDGVVNLRTGLRTSPVSTSEYEETSPPAVIGDVLVVGSAIADNSRVNAPSGEVRAFSVRTGRLLWTWEPLLDVGPVGTGAANAWSIISVDEKRKLVFVPTGSPSPDYYGGERPGDDKYANSVVALNAETGRVVWAFQTVHHDLWDFDVASQPLLYTYKRGRKLMDAVAVGSKTGHLFLLERATGKPIFPVEERPVPQSDVPGEKTSPTQPFPALPLPLVPERLAPEEIWGATDADRKWCQDAVAKLRNEGIFTPPSVRGSLSVPGNIGGMAWGGAAYDPQHELLLIPTNRLPAIVHLIPREEYGRSEVGYRGFEVSPMAGTPYGMARQFLLSPGKSPCNPPPYGALTAINVVTGDKKWEVPLGSLPWLAGHPEFPKLGSINLGGPIVTGGGLAFIGATLDSAFRAFDVETGAELWKAELPASARATPMTFRSKGGKQYVVIASGGIDVPGLKRSDSLIAFTLPQ